MQPFLLLKGGLTGNRTATCYIYGLPEITSSWKQFLKDIAYRDQKRRQKEGFCEDKCLQARKYDGSAGDVAQSAI